MKNNKGEFSPTAKLFFRSMILTAAAVSLILIGYFTAFFLSGGI